jgi:small subunit ribosomal protein S1
MIPPDPDEDEARESAAAAEFAAQLEAFDQTKVPVGGSGARPAKSTNVEPRVGSRLRGRVVSISGDAVLFDIGGRSEGVAAASEFRAEDGTLTVEPGQELELYVVEAAEQVVLARAARSSSQGARGALEVLRQARAAEVPVRGKVTGVNTGGLSIEIDGVRAFCPLSQIDTNFVEDPAPFVGRVLEFLVTEVDASHARVVVSRKKLLQRQQDERTRERLAGLVPGQELEATVTRMEPYGAFVDTGGLDGLVHVSELSHARIEHPRDVVAVGDKLRVKVLRVEPGRDGRARVSLSARAAAADPWATAVQRFVPGSRVQGVVVRLTDFGAFVNLAPGVDGLVHVSQVSNRRIQHAREVLSAGQAVEAVVLAVEPERRRIALSMREAQEQPVEPSRMRLDDEVPPVPPRPSEPEGPTAMQLAFRRAREQQQRGQKQ